MNFPLIYPLTSQNDYSELKFSLRSIDRFIQFPFEVIIVGSRLPSWITNVTHLNLPDLKGRKQISIRRKILAGLQVSGYGIAWNDDIYLLSPLTEPPPYFYRGDLTRVAESGAKKLAKELQNLKRPILHFDIHYPILYEKDKFEEYSKFFSSETIIKSGYCNYWKIHGIYQEDCKIMKQLQPDQLRKIMNEWSFLSTGVYSWGCVLPVLNELFPEKSRFEL